MQSNIASSSEDRSPQPQRLPVNPRRHKVAPEQRKRVVRACNACNVRRVRCSGEQPCQRCCKVSRECEYPAPESDKSELKVELERSQKRAAALERILHATVPDDAAELIRQVDQGEPSESDDAETTTGGLLYDGDGTARYLGETSGATFLDVLKRFMRSLLPLTYRPETIKGSSFIESIGLYQTFDSRPLPTPTVDPVWLPARTDMSLMLAELRYYIQDGNGEFPSGGIYYWGDMNSLPVSMASSASLTAMTTDDTHRYLAFYHVCFALASSIGHSSFRHSEQHTGEAYFMRARQLLGNPLDSVGFTLGDVPVLALMGFYLIELNRRDAAYMYVSLAIHIAMIHGAFSDTTDEFKKRTLWNLYIMDRWLSVLMGRPPTLFDEAMTLPMPSDVASMPPAAGLRAHIELARISGFIVCETYRIAPRDCRPNYSSKSIDNVLKRLEEWKLQLPSALTIPQDQPNPDPACCTLHMAQNQLIVLTTRPIFLAAVKQAVGNRFIGGHWSIEQHTHRSHLQACSAAAHENLVLAQRTQSSRKLLQAGLHFVFNAAVILLLDRLVHGITGHEAGCSNGHMTPTPPGEDLHYLEIQFAISIFEQESKTGTNYPRDCCKVLRDLRALVGHHITQSQLDFRQGDITHRTRNDLAMQSGLDQSPGASSSQPSSSEDSELYQEMMTWVQRDGLQLRDSLHI
ncbi:Nn.00g010600.m01.CDS01 [Neocucurbitaria sp. VM-36]